MTSIDRETVRKRSQELRAERLQYKRKLLERSVKAAVVANDTIRKDNERKLRKNKKRLGAEIAVDFSFLDVAIDDRVRYWSPKSYNEDRQRSEFFRKFVYKYYVPDVLFRGAFVEAAANWRVNARDLARGYLADVVSGGSFAKKHPEFTKAECHFLLSSKREYDGPPSLYGAIWEAKCLARGLNDKLTDIVIRVFPAKFTHVPDHLTLPIVRDFFDFVYRYGSYDWTSNELLDVADFVMSKIATKETFSFSGRTVKSVIDLSNAWHEEQAKKNDTNDLTWPGLRYADASYEDHDFLWEITQIKNNKKLVHEGKVMHHCVASYYRSCASGRCGIYHVGRMNKVTGNVENCSTFEVTDYGKLTQHRAKCNDKPSKSVVRVVKRWCLEKHVEYSEVNF